MVQEIHLNGGPWHDHRLAIPDGHKHFHIREATTDEMPTFAEILTGILTTVPYREGTYSRVDKYPGEFEWDGWISHGSEHTDH